MPASRRAFLAGSGLLAAGGIGVWQRNRVIRYPEAEEMREAVDQPIPTIEAGPPVDDSHLEAAHDRALAAIESAHSATPDDQLLNTTPSDLERFAPAEVAEATRAERRRALDRLRIAIRGPNEVAGTAMRDDGELEESGLESRADETRAALEAAETPYRGESLADAVIANGIVDDRRLEAERYVDEVDDRFHRSDRDFGLSWRDLATADANLEDGDWHERDVDGEDYEDELRAVLENAVSLLDGRDRDEEIGDIDGWPSYAYDLSRHEMPRGTEATDPATKLEGGYLASGVRAASYRYTIFELFGRFDEIPARPFWRELEWAVDADGLPERKAAAVTAIESALESRGDPLGEWLLADAAEALERADDTLERRIDSVNDFDTDRWQNEINDYHVACLTAEAMAEQVPDTMTTLLE